VIPFKTEPALIVSLVMAVIGLLVAFGVVITMEQQDAIKIVLTEFFALMVASGVIIRSHVTPTE
jgi:hypothetical protein